MKTITLFAPFFKQGGVERCMLDLSKGFSERGFAVDLVVATKASAYISEISPRVRLIELRARNPILSLPRLMQYLQTTRPVAIISGLTPANLVAVSARRFLRLRTVKVIIRVEVSVGIQESTTPFKARLRPFVYRLFYPWADYIVAISQGVERELLDLGLSSRKIRQIYNPVNISEIEERAKESVEHPWFKQGEPPILLGVGRLHKQKDFDTLVRAFALVNKERDVRLVILGDGEERTRLERLIQELGLEGRVSLLGFVENPFKYMARARLFVLSSRYEGFSRVVAEALSLGIHVVSTDCPHGPREILEDGRCGILVPVGDVNGLANAVLEALDRNWDKNALQRRAQAFNIDKIVDRYLEMII